MLELILNRYAQVTRQIEELEKEREELRQLILKNLSTGIHSIGAYQVTIQEKELVTYDPLKVYEIVNDLGQFMKLVKIQNSKVEALKLNLADAIKERKTIKTVSVRKK